MAHIHSIPTGPDAVPVGSEANAGLAVQVHGLSKSFGARRVLRDIDLGVRSGEFVAIVGRSGCGKSTLLRLLAGLETPDTGDIQLQGQALNRQHPAHQGIRLMFQDARLLPWKSVEGNVGLGLQGPDRAERVREALDAVGLLDRLHDWPSTLSGGQKQRVALARALVHRPRLMLLDEPLGALDALTRIEMHGLIERLWRQHGFTALLVTHDVSEAVALADRILLIEEQQTALDLPVRLPRPRARGSAEFAETQDHILQRVLRRPIPATTAARHAGDAPPLQEVA